VKCSTSNCGSKPPGNKKNDRISQTPSSSKIAKIVESKNANHSEPNQTWGSNATDIPSSSSLVMTGCPDCTLVSGLRMFKTHDKESLSAYELYNGTKFVNQILHEFYENVGISHQTSVARTPQQNGVVKRRNQTLVEADRTMLIFSKAPLFLWAKAINTACYTQNRSLIRLRYNKTPYELMQDKKLDLSFLHVFGSLCYPTNDHEDLGLVSKHVSQQPCILPNRDDWDWLFQPMFDEYFNPPTITVSPVQEAAATRAKVLADSPVSIFINQD
ncbi:retrovirus-related pol polyprotein from transposon TNT 1-94, partial [Tanacetum coccineum]